MKPWQDLPGFDLSQSCGSPLTSLSTRASFSTTKATVLNGYYTPKDTCVFINQWQVNHDE